MQLIQRWILQYYHCTHQWTYPRQSDGSYKKICQHCAREKRWIYE